MPAPDIRSRDTAWDFAPEIVKAQERPPSPLPRAFLFLLLGLFGAMVVWAFFGRLDMVAVAQGKLVPQSFLKIVQPAESGIVREILVSEGESVRAGQILVRMDTRLSQADLRTLEAELVRRNLQLRRIDAELAGTALARRTNDSADQFARVEAQRKARRQAYLDALGAEQAILVKTRQDLQGAVEVEQKLERTLPIYRAQANAWDKLATEGFAGKLMALDRQRGYVEAEQDLAAQKHAVKGLKATISQAEKRIAQIESGYRQQLHQERADAQVAYARLQQDWEKQRHRHSLLELRAPEAGVVKDLATHTPGTVVAPGTILLTLVPKDEPLLAEVWVANLDAGFVQAMQKVRVKLVAYPFQKYGMLDGAVRQVSADAQEKADVNGARNFHDAAYRTLITLDREYLENGERRLRLVPGMLVNAEIHLGTRSVFEYLLSPIQKVAHEAGRER
ncbi:MAG: secretion protein HylD [Myxococcales bacterium SG8_38_1]|jgi:hemolysin D|nr:MAG: secretion protein HylD [Myxococcales bacterium SG8_38_1]